MTMMQWYAGNLMCKVLMMIRTGGYILSSLLLVVISIDRHLTMWFANSIFVFVCRYICISNPLSSINTIRQRNRAR